jgi:hypothetical protein
MVAVKHEYQTKKNHPKDKVKTPLTYVESLNMRSGSAYNGDLWQS